MMMMMKMKQVITEDRSQSNLGSMPRGSQNALNEKDTYPIVDESRHLILPGTAIKVTGVPVGFWACPKYNKCHGL
jgi:hypothetical protein